MTIIHIKINRPILKLAYTAKEKYLASAKKHLWQKPKVMNEIKCQGVSPTHVSTLK